MAKKRAAPKAVPRTTLRPGTTVISMKVTEEFRHWLAGVADELRVSSVTLIEHAVVEYARVKVPGKPAPRRTEGR